MPKRGWPTLATSFVILTVAFSFGLFSLPVFYPVLTKKFGWSHAEAAAGGSIVLLLIGVLSPSIGWLVDKLTPKLVLMAGMLIVALSLSLLSLTQSLTGYYAFCALLGLGGAAVSLVPNSILIAPWFSKQRGLALGVINAGVGVGGLIAPRLSNFLIHRQGPSQAFLSLACFLAVPFLLTLACVPRSAYAGGNAGRRAASLLAAPSAAQLMKSPMFWVFGLSLLCAAHTLTGIQQHLVLYLTGQGVNAQNAASALSILLGASAVGKILGGLVADRSSSRVSILASIPCLAIGICGLLTASPGSSLIYWISAMFGLGYGGVFNGPPLIAFEYFGTAGVGTILGLLTFFFGAGTSSGGLVAGIIYDHTHRYSAAFTFDLASASVAFLLLFAGGLIRSVRSIPEPSGAYAK